VTVQPPSRGLRSPRAGMRTSPGGKVPMGSSSVESANLKCPNAGSVQEFTVRIQTLESELDSACETMRNRQKRRGGSAPPCPVLVAKEAAGDATRQAMLDDQDQQPLDCFSSPQPCIAAPSTESSPCVPPLPGLRPLSAESGSAELWAVCEAMQLQRRETLQLIRDACHYCGVVPSVGMASEDAKALLDAICAAHPGASYDFNEDAPRTPPQHRRRSVDEVQNCNQLGVRIQQLQEQLRESEQQRMALQATLESTIRAGNCSQQATAERCSVAAQTIELEPSNFLGANAGAGHFDSNLSMLSVSISPHGGMPSSPELGSNGRSVPGVGHQRHPLAEVLAMLRQLVEDGAAKAAPGTNLSGKQALANLTLAERLDLLDLAAAVRSAEPLLVEVAASSASTSRQVNCAEHGLSRTSLASSMASMTSLPAAGRLSELADDKLREVMELQVRCDKAQSSEARLEAATLLAAAREELRLLREYAGLEPLGIADLNSIATSG